MIKMSELELIRERHMTITAVSLQEFNPFHNGHKYFTIEQAKGLKIIAMSGNFVSNGEPAIVDKWIRGNGSAEMALIWCGWIAIFSGCSVSWLLHLSDSL